MASAERNAIASVCHRCKIVVIALLSVVFRTRALSFGGFCTRCSTHHVLPTTDEAKQAAIDLRDRMIRSGRIDIDELPAEAQKRLLSRRINEDREFYSTCVDDDLNRDSCLDMNLDPRLAIERLYDRRGKMFGVLICKAPDNKSIASDSMTYASNTNSTIQLPATVRHQGDIVILKAYAGKLGDRWNLSGWAPLVGKVPERIPLFRQMSAEVTELFEKIDKLSEDEESSDTEESAAATEQIKELKKERSRLASLSIEELRRHQVLTNFRGIRMPIKDAFAKGPTKLPGGTGDCAAPKLLALAARLGLQPTGICEIFVGATGGMSTTKKDGKFYDACEPRCQQIAGHMLCGLEL